MEVEFAWDSAKHEANVKKHGVGFHEAATVLEDPLSTTFPDHSHSVEEHDSRHQRPTRHKAGKRIL